MIVDDYINFQKISIFTSFFDVRRATFPQRFPLAEAHRGANPLACAPANIKSRPGKSEKWLPIREKFENLRKTPLILRKGL